MVQQHKIECICKSTQFSTGQLDRISLKKLDVSPWKTAISFTSVRCKVGPAASEISRHTTALASADFAVPSITTYVEIVTYYYYNRQTNIKKYFIIYKLF